MAITSSDIHNQSFSIDRKGYDVDEVDVFLEHVAEEIDELNNKVADLEDQLDAGDSFGGLDVSVNVEDDAEEPEAASESASAIDEELLAEKDARIAELEEQLAEKTANDNAISQALIIAQRSADDIIARAKADAAETVADAKDEAQRIIDRAQSEKQEIIDAIHRLEDDREDAREEYEDLLKDFISDATRKLASIGGSMRDASHARAVSPAKDAVEEEKPQSAQGATGQMLPVHAEPVDPVASYTTPTMAGAAVVAATPNAAPVVEKDLSGFGDADDFSFDDLD